MKLNNKKWKCRDVKRLMRLVRRKVPIERIAIYLDRSPMAVARKYTRIRHYAMRVKKHLDYPQFVGVLRMKKPEKKELERIKYVGPKISRREFLRRLDVFERALNDGRDPLAALVEDSKSAKLQRWLLRSQHSPQ